MGVGCGRKGGGRERESNAKRVHRDEKCTDSTFKSIRRRMLSLDGKRRVHSAQWVSTPKETRVGRKKVSSGRLPLLIGREFLDTYRLLFCLACYLSTLVSNVFRKRCSPSSGIFELCPLRVFVSSLFRIRSTSFCLISFDNSVGGGGILDPSCLCFSCQPPGNVKYS